jgi:hypothetical protein
MLVLAPDSSRKISLDGSSPACSRRHVRRARAISGRSCSLARNVFFYMSAPASAKHSGWQARCNPVAWLDAVRPKSNPASAPKAASFVARGQGECVAWDRKSGGAGQCLLFAGAAAGASSPNRERPGNGWRSPPGCPLIDRKKPGCVLANPRKSFPSTNSSTAQRKRLQFYLKCSRA